MKTNSLLIKQIRVSLSDKGLSNTSITLYLSDIKSYINWISKNYDIKNSQISKDLLFSIMDRDNIKEYLSFLTKKGTSYASMKRHIASLKHLTLFIGNRKLLEDITPQKLVPGSVQLSAQSFQEYLKNKSVSEKTIINYKLDVEKYLNWKSSNQLSTPIKYLESLKGKYSTSSIRRKKFALNKYKEFTSQASQPKTQAASDEQNLRSRFTPKFAIGTAAFAALLVFNIPTEQQSTIYSTTPTKTYSLKNIDETGLSFPDQEISEAEGLTIVLEGENLNDTKDIEIYKVALKEGLSQTELPSEELSTSYPYQGQATIPSGKTEVLISNNNIDSDTIIFLTLTSNPGDSQIFISQQTDGYFTVSLSKATNKDINFNWLIRETEVYHSIL